MLMFKLLLILSDLHIWLTPPRHTLNDLYTHHAHISPSHFPPFFLPSLLSVLCHCSLRLLLWRTKNKNQWQKIALSLNGLFQHLPSPLHPSIHPLLRLSAHPFLLPLATSWACWRRRLCGGWSLLVGEGKEQREFGGFWGWMRSSERATRAGAAAAAADSLSRPPPPLFKNTSWHARTHMHIFTHNKTSRHCPLIGLIPSIWAMWAWNTHGGQHGKTKICT